MVPRRRRPMLEKAECVAKCARCLSAALRAEHLRGPPEVVPPDARNAASRRGAALRNDHAAKRAAESAGEEAVTSRAGAIRVASTLLIRLGVVVQGGGGGKRRRDALEDAVKKSVIRPAVLVGHPDKVQGENHVMPRPRERRRRGCGRSHKCSAVT